MARGYMYEIQEKPYDIGSFGEEDLYESLEALNVDFVQDISENNAPDLASSFIQTLAQCGAEVGIEEAENWDGEIHEVPWFILTDDVRRNFFRVRYRDMKSMAMQMTLDEFAMDTGLALYDLRMNLKNTMGNMVFFKGTYKEVDTFVRTAPSDTKYYVGSVVLLH